MAVKTSYVDDHDGKALDDDVTIKVVVGDRQWTVNLSEKNIDALQDTVQKFVPDVAPEGVTAARSNGRGRARSTTPKNDTKAIRTWARENGHEVKDRGRIDQAIVEAYNAAHGK